LKEAIMQNSSYPSPNRHKNSTVWTMILFVLFQFLVVAAAFLGGFLVHQWGFRDSGFGLIAPSSLPILDEAYQLLEKNAYFELPEKKKLEYGMIRGMVTAANEPHTVFVEPPQHELQTNQLDGRYGGIGVRIERDDQRRIYLYPLPDSPALQAGVQDGDRLLQVENLVIEPETGEDVVQAAVRGKVGEKVKIVVGRAPDWAPLEFAITRAEVPLPSVTWNLAPEDARVGVVHINVIADTTPKEVQAAVETLQSQGAVSFVMDVRNNGGGLVEAGVDTARLFLKGGPIIEQQYKDQPVKAFNADRPGTLANLNMVVLVNGGTASAAEIFAGALKGQKRATIVGARTYGKDTIQLVFNLSDGSSLHVTSAHWWVPGLEPKIGVNGVQPDITVAENADDAAYMQLAIDTVLQQSAEIRP
jgi:carboxyl-terminal processing protease